MSIQTTIRPAPAFGARRLLALCGFPECGKSFVQEILTERFGAKPVDDGWPLRDFAIRHMGATLEDVATQEGKRRIASLNGEPMLNLITGAPEPMTWRDVLGKVGNQLEALFGEDFLPRCAMRECVDPAALYTFGSVRKLQGRYYARQGGVVVEILRRGCAPRGDFDRYDPSAVHLTIENPLPLGEAPTPEAAAAFRRNVLAALEGVLLPAVAA